MGTDTQYYRLHYLLFHRLTTLNVSKNRSLMLPVLPITNHDLFFPQNHEFDFKIMTFYFTYSFFLGEILTLENTWRSPVLSKQNHSNLPLWKAGVERTFCISGNRIAKAENLLLASNILVLSKGYSLQTVKCSVASFLSSDKKKDNLQSSIIPSQKVYVR